MLRVKHTLLRPPHRSRGACTAKGNKVLFESLRKRHSGGWRAGVMRGGHETALAIVRMTKGQRPLLRHCAVHPAIEIQAEHVFAALSRGARQSAARPVSRQVLNSGDYEHWSWSRLPKPPRSGGPRCAGVARHLGKFPGQRGGDRRLRDSRDGPSRRGTHGVRRRGARRGREQHRGAREAARPRLRRDRYPGSSAGEVDAGALLPQDEQGLHRRRRRQGFLQPAITCQGQFWTLALAHRPGAALRGALAGWSCGYRPAERRAAALARLLRKSLRPCTDRRHHCRLRRRARPAAARAARSRDRPLGAAVRRACAVRRGRRRRTRHAFPRCWLRSAPPCAATRGT